MKSRMEKSRCGENKRNELAEHSVFAVQVCLLRVGDKELRFVGVGTRVSHGDHSPCIELQSSIGVNVSQQVTFEKK